MVGAKDMTGHGCRCWAADESQRFTNFLVLQDTLLLAFRFTPGRRLEPAGSPFIPHTTASHPTQTPLDEHEATPNANVYSAQDDTFSGPQPYSYAASAFSHTPLSLKCPAPLADLADDAHHVPYLDSRICKSRISRLFLPPPNRPPISHLLNSTLASHNLETSATEYETRSFEPDEHDPDKHEVPTQQTWPVKNQKIHAKPKSGGANLGAARSASHESEGQSVITR